MRTYLNRGFGHPCQSYEGFLLRGKASTQHTDIGEQDSDQQSDEDRSYAQTCRTGIVEFFLPSNMSNQQFSFSVQRALTSSHTVPTCITDKLWTLTLRHQLKHITYLPEVKEQKVQFTVYVMFILAMQIQIYIRSQRLNVNSDKSHRTSYLCIVCVCVCVRVFLLPHRLYVPPAPTL